MKLIIPETDLKSEIETLYAWLKTKGFTARQAIKLLDQTRDAIEQTCREEIKKMPL